MDEEAQGESVTIGTSFSASFRKDVQSMARKGMTLNFLQDFCNSQEYISTYNLNKAAFSQRMVSWPVNRCITKRKEGMECQLN